MGGVCDEAQAAPLGRREHVIAPVCHHLDQQVDLCLSGIGHVGVDSRAEAGGECAQLVEARVVLSEHRLQKGHGGAHEAALAG